MHKPDMILAAYQKLRTYAYAYYDNSKVNSFAQTYWSEHIYMVGR